MKSGHIRRTGSPFNTVRMLALFMALVFSLMMWLVLNLNRSYQHNVTIPIVAHCDELEGYSQASHVTYVTARCVAPGSMLIDYQMYDDDCPINVWIDRKDLQESRPGTFFITSKDFSKYESKVFIEANSVNVFQDTIYFHFKEENCRKLPVVFDYELSCQPQYMVQGEPLVRPDSILVFGEPMVIDDLESVMTAPVSKGRVDESVHGIVKLRKINGVRFSAEEVDYKISVVRYVEIQQEVPIVIRNKPAGRSYIVYPSLVMLAVRVPVDDPDIRLSQVSCYVDYNENPADSGNDEYLVHIECLDDKIIDCQTDCNTARIIYSGR